ncbi:hypothetical protein A3K42_01470 [candidate division WWE3 bacterium RBG_13_37_7]|uniref:Uncharacterized protein n=1 Tax=candidate division WWE3 bacterium RBG_13_37_7 TaxID=1802609 RepID=A0A1F4U0X1_UNCKA|nr:MAG: hypothetical protein A3K42_01470 [candidate division WWE3 bacterium RBG_13_37_7]
MSWYDNDNRVDISKLPIGELLDRGQAKCPIFPWGSYRNRELNPGGGSVRPRPGTLTKGVSMRDHPSLQRDWYGPSFKDKKPKTESEPANKPPKEQKPLLFGFNWLQLSM